MDAAQHIVQNAYLVNDIDQAIERWHGLWGIGPFFVRRHIQFSSVVYRGAASTIDMSAAYVQAGAIQVELVTQHDHVRSAFRDMFAPGAEGLHHVAVLPENYEEMIAHYTSLGYPVAAEVRTAGGRGAGFVDTRPLLGHMMEVYVPGEGINSLYRDVAAAAASWDRRQLKVEVDPSK
jgi:hypothetical protein